MNRSSFGEARNAFIEGLRQQRDTFYRAWTIDEALQLLAELERQFCIRVTITKKRRSGAA
jgi:hypothetical protein